MYIFVLRTVIAYFLLLIFTRVMGRKLISQMTFFDFAVGVTLGTITASIALGTKYTPVSAGIVLLSLTLLTILTGWLDIKGINIRKILNSEPVVLVKNGEINEQNMRKTRMTVNELLMELRKKNVFNVSDVEFAIAEIDGKLSVLTKTQKQPVTPSDLDVDTSYQGLMTDLIMDGRVLKENLSGINLDEEWLKNKLAERGFSSPEYIFYAGLDSSGGLYISEKHPGQEETPGEYGIE